MTNKNTPLIVIILIVLVALGFVAFYMIHRQVAIAPTPKQVTPTSGEKPSQVPLKVEHTDVPVAQVPQSFPAGMPIEKGAKITQNYNSVGENGVFQATRVFQTAKSLDENFKIYADYINSNGWKLTNSLNQSNIKVLVAQKDKGDLQITMNQNSETHVSTVSISYSEKR